jgi:hypothetical protein
MRIRRLGEVENGGSNLDLKAEGNAHGCLEHVRCEMGVDA